MWQAGATGPRLPVASAAAPGSATAQLSAVAPAAGIMTPRSSRGLADVGPQPGDAPPRLPGPCEPLASGAEPSFGGR